MEQNSAQSHLVNGKKGQFDCEILGVATDGIAGLSIDELTNNKTAITMLVHYYKTLKDENSTLRNDLNTARTYVDGYEKKEVHARVGAVLLLIANVGIGFGTNLLSTGVVAAGIITLVPALVIAGTGTYYAMKGR